MKPVQRVIDVASRAALWVREAGAIRRGVVAIACREIPAGQKRIAGGGARQAAHVVEGKRVRPGGIRDLRQPRVFVICVIHRGAIRVRFLRQAVQLVVSVGNQLVLPISFARQIAHGVVPVSFDVAGRKRGLRHASKRVIRKRSSVIVRVLDARQIIFRVVAIGGHIAPNSMVGERAL